MNLRTAVPTSNLTVRHLCKPSQLSSTFGCFFNPHSLSISSFLFPHFLSSFTLATFASLIFVHACILSPFSTSIHSLTLFTQFFLLNLPSSTTFSSIIHMKQPQTLFLISICRTNLFDILPYKLISHSSLVSVFFLLSSPHTVKRNKLSATNSA